METMLDGSPMLKPGTYVRVHQRQINRDDGSIFMPEQNYIAKVVGTDLGRSKYELGERYGGWNEWLFLDGGSWAFIGQVTEIDQAEALAVPEQSA